MAGCAFVVLAALAVPFIVLGLKSTATIVLSVVALSVVIVIVGRTVNARLRASRADGSYARKFVYVEDDGSARELTATERDYLNTEFQGADGARPYIKYRYASLTPDRRLRGFLLRRKLPRHMDVKPTLSH